MAAARARALQLFFCLVIAVLVLLVLDRNMRLSQGLRQELDEIRGRIVRENNWITQNLLEIDKERKRAIRYVCLWGMFPESEPASCTHHLG